MPKPSLRPKVAIPRLRTEDQEQRIRANKRLRIDRACGSCRIHKVKCDGTKPVCNRCFESHAECGYVMPRKDRLKFMIELARQSTDLLRDLRDIVSADKQKTIDEILSAFQNEVAQMPCISGTTTPESEHCDIVESTDTAGLLHQGSERRETFANPEQLPDQPIAAPVVMNDTTIFYTGYDTYDGLIPLNNLDTWDANAWLEDVGMQGK